MGSSRRKTLLPMVARFEREGDKKAEVSKENQKYIAFKQTQIGRT